LQATVYFVQAHHWNTAQCRTTEVVIFRFGTLLVEQETMATQAKTIIQETMILAPVVVTKKSMETTIHHRTAAETTTTTPIVVALTPNTIKDTTNTTILVDQAVPVILP